MDKQKQMRDKLIKIIKKQSVCCNGNDCDKCYYDGDNCVEERLADAIIDSNAIIPEGAVVLPKVVWDNIQDVLDGKCDICLEQTRKETVKLCRNRVYRVVTKTLNEFFFKGENSKIKACEPIPTNDFVWFDGVLHERVNDCFDEIDEEITEGTNGKKEDSIN